MLRYQPRDCQLGADTPAQLTWKYFSLGPLSASSFISGSLAASHRILTVCSLPG